MNIEVLKLRYLFFPVAQILSFSSLLVAGMAFGTGSAVAHRAVDAVMGPRTIQHENVVSEAASAAPVSTTSSFGGSDACNIHSKAFQDVCTFLPSLILLVVNNP